MTELIVKNNSVINANHNLDLIEQHLILLGSPLIFSVNMK